jgi:RNA polymerase sigma-70 factor, ECF subfamily
MNVRKAHGRREEAMRNISGDDSLQQDMEEWSQNPLNPLMRLTPSLSPGLAPGLDAPAEVAPLVAPEEAALIARAQQGDQDAFAVLVRTHQRQVYSLALRMLRENEAAYEATQEVFLAAWQGLRSFKGKARFATWLYRITYHHCLRVAEAQKREMSLRAELRAESAREMRPEQVVSARHAGEAERAMRETVRDELASLPPKYRLALTLRHLQDLSYEEMAQVMQAPIGTVKTHLFRARSLLKERLQSLEQFRDEGVARAGGLRASLEAGLRTILDRANDTSHPAAERSGERSVGEGNAR